jgi:hypothetical protein
MPPFSSVTSWFFKLRGKDLNLRPLGYENHPLPFQVFPLGLVGFSISSDIRHFGTTSEPAILTLFLPVLECVVSMC